MNRLEEILVHKRKEVAKMKATGLQAKLKTQVKDLPEPRNFYAAISAPELTLIAEVKKASPSAGLIREKFDPVQIAQTYEAAGAKCLSVLTDGHFFQGKLDDLTDVHKNTTLPCLRKDFIIDPIQIYEARAAEADAILLIVAALTDEELRSFLELAQDLKLHVLTEVHNETELNRALRAGASVIGINNRDLTTLQISLNTTAELIVKIPENRLIVSESGIKTPADVHMLKLLGVDAILVGESLLKQSDLEAAVRTLMGTKVLLG